MKKLFMIITIFVLSVTSFATINVRKMNEYLMFKKGYTNEWHSKDFCSKLYGKNSKYADCRMISYHKGNAKGADYMTMVYKPQNDGPKGHWAGEVMIVEFGTQNTSKASFNSMLDMINAFLSFNDNKKQTALVREAIKTQKDNPKKKISVMNLDVLKSITIKFQ